MDASQSVHKLSLILVNSLDLNGEERIRIDRDSKSSFNVFSQSDLVVHLDFVEALNKGRIVNLVLEPLEQDGIGQPLVIA